MIEFKKLKICDFKNEKGIERSRERTLTLSRMTKGPFTPVTV